MSDSDDAPTPEKYYKKYMTGILSAKVQGKLRELATMCEASLTTEKPFKNHRIVCENIEVATAFDAAVRGMGWSTVPNQQEANAVIVAYPPAAMLESRIKEASQHELV
jgi:hypothetical protein